MRVAMYYNNRDVRLEEMEIPRIGSGEMLVQVFASSICGSDIMEWYRIKNAPLVLGHELAGRVKEVGEGVAGFAEGDRVVATHHVPCFACHYCENGHETVCDTLLGGTHFDPGGFCEYVRLPAINVERGTWLLPEEVTYEAATFVEPLGCVLRGQRTAGMRSGASVLVLGSGIAGLLHIKLALANDAGMVVATDISKERLALASQYGAHYTLAADSDVGGEFRKLNKGRGADIVIVCAAAEAVCNQAFQAVGRGGVILLFAPAPAGTVVPLSINDVFWRRDVTVNTSYAASPMDCVEALEFIRSGRVRIDDMITHRFGLAETGKGFQMVAAGGESLKVIIKPQE
ncbi:MAG: alcohol dehydrogenase catalytic domain-containing protein [Deltaproteobacteria bacterium]|nr:MAG: alcohol dehydrogenase catalytic domain-containing protein [Deltaproteobacteria bacterium]